MSERLQVYWLQGQTMGSSGPSRVLWRPAADVEESEDEGAELSLHREEVQDAQLYVVLLTAQRMQVCSH